MARLPIPGGDSGDWGDILNEFLEQSLQPDGTIKPTALQQAGAAQDDDVVKLAGAQTVGGVKTFSSSPVVPTPTSAAQAANKDYVDGIASSGAPDADASTKGLVRLTGGLGGTADSPTVPGLTGKENTITAGTTGQYYRGDKSWQALDKAAVGLGNVDNTSDAGKPVSTATQTALNGKANSSHTHSVSDITDLDLDVGAVGEASLGAETITEGQQAIGIIKLNDGDPIPPGTPANSIIIVVGG